MSQDATVEKIQKAIAAQRRIPVKEVQVTVIADAGVPGWQLFIAAQQPEGGGRGTFDAGVASATTVETNTEKAMAIVVGAWGYGAKRSVPPARVASVLGALEGNAVQSRTAPIVTEGQIEILRPERRAVVFLPRESTVDGKPAVEYWVTSPEPPLWKSTVVIEPDGKVTLVRKEQW